MPLIVRLQDLEVKDTKDFTLTPEELDLTGIRSKDGIRAHLELFKGKDFVRVQGRVQVTIVLNCARCLEDFGLPIEEKFELDYILGVDPYQRKERIELKKDDINRVYFQGDSIDLGIGIREALVLATPIAPLCKELCAGICPQCGRNLNKGKCGCIK